jgi:hypothetical protein
MVVVLIARFVAVLRSLVGFIAGANRMPFATDPAPCGFNRHGIQCRRGAAGAAPWDLRTTVGPGVSGIAAVAAWRGGDGGRNGS